MNSGASKIKYTTSFPTSLIINGLSVFGYELAKSLTEQGGYVVILDNLDSTNTDVNKSQYLEAILDLEHTGVVDFTGLTDLVAELRRLDYVFYLNHQANSNQSTLTSQEFLQSSSYLNQILKLAADFEALFTLTNSIRGHKFLVDSKGFSAHYLQSQGSNYLTYSQAEFIRYSENLVTEYKQVRNLHAKILRIGEVLGEGVELATESFGKQLVQSAASSQDLYLHDDGLTTDYYVHILDAVYGVIKAQFTKNLQDYIYSIAYPDPITELSFAYKLQELESEAGDIKFIDETESKVNLDLQIYKPAVNLNEIGWLAKISFEKALAQTLAYQKQVQATTQNNAQTGLLAQTIETTELSPAELANLGPLAKLISERRQSQNQQKYVEAMHTIAQKDQYVGLATRLRRALTKQYDALAKRLLFLQNLTLAEVSTYLVLIGIFLGLFFLFLAPVLKLTRDYVGINIEASAIQQAQLDSNWPAVVDNAKSSRQRISETSSLVSQYTSLFELFNLEPTQQNLLASLQALELFFDASARLGQNAEQLVNYYKSSSNELVVRPTNSSIIGVNQKNSASEQVLNLNLLNSNSELVERSLQDSNRILAQVDKTKLPVFLYNAFQQSAKANLQMQATNQQMLKLLDLLTASNNNTYRIAFAVTDPQRPTFSGGELTAVGLIEISQAKITGFQLIPLNNIALAKVSLSPSEVSELKELSTNANLNLETAKASEVLRYAQTDELYLSIFKKSLGTALNKNIDASFKLSTASLETLLAIYGPVEVNGQSVAASNYTAAISSLQKNSDESRSAVLTNILGVLLIKQINPEDKNLFEKLNFSADLAGKGFIGVDNNLARLLSLSETPSTNSVSVYLENLEPSQFSTQAGVDLKLTSSLTGTKLTNSLKVDLVNSNNPQNLNICFDRSSTNLNLGALAPEKYRLYSLDQVPCILIKSKDLASLTINFEVSIPSLDVDYSLQVNPGLLIRYDVQTDFETGYQLKSANPTPNQQTNSVFYSGEVYNQFRFNLKLINSND